MRGFLRSDGRKGIRNIIAVAYLVECAQHVAREIVMADRQTTHLIGFPGCYPNVYAQKMMERLCTHPNVGAVLLVSLGCESFNRLRLKKVIKDSGRRSKILLYKMKAGL
jgi:altronate dehydratase large subunit